MSTGLQPKHIPQRTCMACRQGDAKRSLVRLVRVAEGRVEIDPTGKRNGRGAYLCRARDCWEVALKRHSIERALRLDMLHPADRETLEQFASGLAYTTQDDTNMRRKK